MSPRGGSEGRASCLLSGFRNVVGLLHGSFRVIFLDEFVVFWDIIARCLFIRGIMGYYLVVGLVGGGLVGEIVWYSCV